MRKARLTVVQQIDVKILDEKDDPDYKANIPPGGEWELIEYPDGYRRWHPKHRYTFSTPEITDHNKVEIVINT